MQSENFREGEAKTTEVHIPEIVAEFFPVFLDYLYFFEIQIDKESFLPLRWLAKYFGNQSLEARVEEFASSFQPQLDDFLPLHELATGLHDEAFLNLLAVSFGECLMTADTTEKDEEIKQKVSQDFLRDILPKVSPHPVPNSECDWDKPEWIAFSVRNGCLFETVPALLQDFFKAHQKEALDLWRLLTSAEKLPEVKGFGLALFLLLGETALATAAGEINPSSEPTELQRRCLEVVEGMTPVAWADDCWSWWEARVDQIFEKGPPIEVTRGLNRAWARFAKSEREHRSA